MKALARDFNIDLEGCLSGDSRRFTDWFEHGRLGFRGSEQGSAVVSEEGAESFAPSDIIVGGKRKVGSMLASPNESGLV